MAIVRAKVIGPLPICDVHTGNTVEIDTDHYNVTALVLGGHIELLKDAEPVEVPVPELGKAEVQTIPGEPA